MIRPVVLLSRAVALALALAVAVVAPAAAQAPAAQHTLGHADILVYGIGLTAAPSSQTVPKDIATIVSTFLQAPSQPNSLPPFADDAVVMATLRGPSFPSPVELSAEPNTPFNIPPLTVPGLHVLENIRLVSGGEVLLHATPDHTTIDVIEKLLVTQVTARALTAAEIRDKGIVFDSSNFQAYNFSAAFAIADQPVDLNFPVVLPRLASVGDISSGTATLPSIAAPGLPSLKTIIPDTLKLQTRIPNLTVVGFTLQVPQLQGQSFVVPPIPGVVVIPGDIGFLNQYFSVMLMVGNVAPAGSNLVVTDLQATIVLPPGRDLVADSTDDPLRMAQTTQGPPQRIRIVAQPGPDGKVGTADDIASIGPGESGNAEYLVEGRREGSHVVEMQMTGTLNGLPGGPVTITGRAAGSVLVRNPNFSLTFAHPEVVSAGEPYTLDVTVTNTSQSPANFISLNLYPRNVIGATIVGSSSLGIQSIAPGDSETVSFSLVSRLSGKVTAATLDADGSVAGQFELKAAVGELGVPLSPDSLVLPKEAASLPADLKAAALGLLGKAHAVATAPAAALPPDVRRFSRKVVIDRAVQVAEAGLRLSLNEPLAVSTAQLLMDFVGSDAARLASLYPDPADQAFEKNNMEGFDELRRRSVRGDRLAEAVAAILAADLSAKGAEVFLGDLAKWWSYRPGHVAVLVSGNGLPLPARFVLSDAQQRSVGPVAPDGKIAKEIPYSDVLDFTDGAGNVTARLILIAAPQPGAFQIAAQPLAGVPANASYLVSIVAPGQNGQLSQVTSPVIAFPARPAAVGGAGAPFTFTFDNPSGSGTPFPTPVPVVDPPPTVISVIQQANADTLKCEPDQPGTPVGRIVAILFSEEVTPASVQDRIEAALITNYNVEANQVVGVALQPGRRIAFVALRDPFGPFVPRQITISNVSDMRGNVMAPWSGPMQATLDEHGGVVSGRVIDADGTPVPSANVRLFALLRCEDSADPTWVGISSKLADANGQYQFDYVTRLPERVVAIRPDTSEARYVRFDVQRDGQRLNVDIVYLGRGSLTGATYDEQGRPLAQTAIRVSSLTDGSQYGATTDASGRFTVPGIPVGNFFVEAVNVTARAQFSFSDFMPAASAVVQRDITLLEVASQTITVKQGALSGHVLRADGVTPVVSAPVIVWYTNNSQPGVYCPGIPAPTECAIALATADGQGAFTFAAVTAGELRLSSFDQGSLTEGEARLVLAANGAGQVNVLLGGGLGTVQGVVLDANQQPVAGAAVGGGLSLTTTAADGSFTLTDVPIGRREIVAVSQTLGARGSTMVDIPQAGQVVNATVVFDPIGSVSGVVVAADGLSPMANVKVHLFALESGNIVVAGTTTTDANGGFAIPSVPAGNYQLSAFNAGFSDGNIVPAVVKHQGQTFRTTIRFRGAGGQVTGRVLDENGSPLAARVAVSGDQVAVAGGLVGVKFERVDYFKVVDNNPATGAFAFSNLFVGPVTVSAVGQFSPDPVSIDTNIPSPGAVVNVDLKLQPTSEIKGTVLLPNGVQAAGANLVVTYKSEAYKVICSESSSGEQSCDSIPQGIQQANAVTDAQGRFWFPVVNPGPFSITVDDPATGRVSKIQGTVRPGETADLTARLFSRGDVTVQVFGSNTTSIVPGARVEVQQLGYPNRSVTFTADAQGIVQLTGGDAIAEGGFVVTATDLSTGFSGRASGAVVSDGQQLLVKVYLFNAAGTVSGTIFAPDGFTPVANAEVIVSGPGGPLAFAVTDSNGQYSVGTVPLGAVTIDTFDARTGRRGTAAGRVDANGQAVTIDVIEAAIGLVRGQVLDANTLLPLKGWEVTMTGTSVSGLTFPTLRTTTGVDGRFSFPGTIRGAVSLTATRQGVAGHGTARGWIQSEGQVVDVPVLVNITRQLTGGISGVVLTANGAPAPNAAIELCLPNRCDQSPVQITAAADGTFVYNGAPLGRFSVTARSQTTADTGNAFGEIAFDGDVASVTVVLSGLGRIDGHVSRANGSAAANVSVTLKGYPSSGCQGDCVQSTDAAGDFTFAGVPAKTFTVTAVDAASGLKGVTGGALNPGEQKSVQIVLEPTSTVTGRVLTSAGLPAQGAVAELIVDPSSANERHLYRESAADGTFDFTAVPMKAYQLEVSDPIGPGIASRAGTIVGPLALGDLVLDEAPPQVASVIPGSASRGVARDSVVTITFTEPVLPGTVNPANVTLSGPAGPVTATLDVRNNDTVLVIDPLVDLQAETTYTLRVQNLKDRVQKPMPSPYTATFTTVDVTKPTIADASPAAGASGVTIYTPIRILYSEAIDSGSFSGAPIALSGPSGPIAGSTSYLFGNTVIVFTPNAPLAEGATYQVTVQPATDLNGLTQSAPFAYAFSTTTRTPPTLTSLVPASNGQVIEGGIGRVTANPAPNSDVLFVDFYVNGTLAGTVRTAPFEFAFTATPALGAPGDTIALSAIPTDTSGNRGLVPATAQMTIVADQPPAVNLTLAVPGGSTAAKNGDRIVVTVTATDDVGLTDVGYRAATGNPADALTEHFAPTVPSRTSSFAFHVPATAGPGQTIDVEAAAIDSKGQTQTAIQQITVVDAVAPVVQITGATTGTTLRPGQTTTVVVTAQDLGGVASLAFTAGGLVTKTEARTIDPAQSAVVATFTVTVPGTAQTGDTLTLDAAAVDRAGNSGTAARVILPIADAVPPVVSLQTSNGSLDIVPGQTVTVVVSGDDQGLVSELRLSGSGGMTFAHVQQVTPPSGSASLPFTLTIPASLPIGSQVQLSALAVDLAGNISAPASLTLTAVSSIGVSLPASQIVKAGETITVPVTLDAPAPAGGIRVDIHVDDAAVATATPFVQFGDGETASSIQVTGVAGGTTVLRALVQSVQRASMTVAVIGGVVTGTVLDSHLNPVANAQLTISGGGATVNATSDAAGHYEVQGVAGPGVSVKALDPVSRLRGFSSGTMLHAGGSIQLNVVLIPAGGIQGTVFEADGVTPAGAGVQVDIRAAGDSQPLATVFTDAASQYEFPLVTLGDYVVEAAATNGSRGKASVSLVESGAEVTLPIVYLGHGTVQGIVKNGGGAGVANAALTLRTWDAFGAAAPVLVNADASGAFSFTNVPLGSFSIDAVDQTTGLKGSVAGTLGQHLQVVTVDIVTASFGSLHGTIFRDSSGTPAVGARVSAGGRLVTTSATGAYRFDILPLGTYQVTVNDPGTRGLALSSVTLAANGQDLQHDLTLAPQGRLFVTVEDSNGVAVPNAFVQVSSVAGVLQDAFSATAANGTVLVEHVLAGTVTVSASAGGLAGRVSNIALASGALVNVTVPLEPTGTITGTIYAPDGQTPAAGGSVRMYPGQRSVAIGADGSYTFAIVPKGQYTLSVYDAQGRLRAQSAASAVVIAANNQVVTADYIEIGLGTVRGRVVHADGSSAQAFAVTLNSLTPVFGGYRSATTDGGGFYVFSWVPLGAFKVTTGKAAQQLLGEASGVLTTDGQDFTADIVLQNNAVTLPLALYDGNNYTYDVYRSGSMATGSAAFGPAPGGQNIGASELTLSLGGAAASFAGDPISTIEDGQREIVTREAGLHGLTVTRKIFVPTDGYFSRELELLTNPGQAPVTVDVLVTSGLRPGTASNPLGAAEIVATSSGDQAFSASDDNWVVVGQAGHTGTPNAGQPGRAFVVEGPGAAQPLTAAGIAGVNPTTLTYGWSNITVPPGQTVGLLHFIAQQTSDQAAQASAERLAQLPPEALDGLSADEVGQIVNFVMPANGISTVAPLPGMHGTVDVRVLEGDAQTPVPQAKVTFQSASVFHQRTFTLTTAADGRASFTTTETSGKRLIPEMPFTLGAVYPADATLVSPQVQGDFLQANPVATSDVVFSNAGVITGTVRRANGAAAPNGTVVLQGRAVNYPVAADASYRIGGVLPGSRQVTAFVPVASGSPLPATGTANVIAGATTTLDLFTPDTYSVTGSVLRASGAAAANVTVKLTASGFNRQVTTSTGGAFAFVDVPSGVYTLSAIEPATSIASSAPVTVADAPATQNVSLIAVGAVQGTVTLTGGGAAAGRRVDLRYVLANGVVGTLNTTTTAIGGYRFDSVPASTFTVEVDDRTNHLYGKASGQLTTDAQQVTLSFTLAINTVTMPVSLYDANGYIYDFDGSGAIIGGRKNVFRGSVNGAAVLQLNDGNAVVRFSGGQYGVQEMAGRQVRLTQAFNGLDVTRKIFVPGQGYFARYVDSFHNPTAQPISIGINLTNVLGTIDTIGPAVRATSSGDLALSAAGDDATRDMWAVFDDSNDADPFVNNAGMTAVGFAFGGPGAASTAGTLNYAAYGSFGGFDHNWGSITVQPGETVSLLHFVVQQTSRAATQASLERLTQLPPEALEGLTAEDLGSIRNFVMPPNGQSALASLPGLTGAITGTVQWPDGTAPVSGMAVTLKSANTIFSRTFQTTTSTSGGYSFTSTFASPSSPVAIALDDYTLTTRVPVTQLTQSATGQFAAGQVTSQTDIVMSSAGSVTGVVRRSNGTPAAGVTVSDAFARSITTTPTGTFTFIGLPAGGMQLLGRLDAVAGQAGHSIYASADVTIAGGVRTQADIVFEPLGAVAGVVKTATGAFAANLEVSASGPSYNGQPFTRWTYTNSVGQYTLSDLLPGSYTITVVDARTSKTVSLPVTVAADAVAPADFTLTPVGSATVTVSLASGQPAANVGVGYTTNNGSSWSSFVYTNASGQVMLGNIPAGAFRVRAAHPLNSSLYGYADAVLTTEGENVPVSLTLPATGQVQGILTTADGRVLANQGVQIREGGTNNYLVQVNSNQNGAFSFTGVPTGVPVHLAVWHPLKYGVWRIGPDFTLSSEGEVHTENISRPALASVALVVTHPDGSPWSGLTVQGQDSSSPYFNHYGTTDSLGRLTLGSVAEGAFALRLIDTNTGVTLATPTGTIAPADDEKTVSFPVQIGQYAGTVSGHVFASDGVTPIQSAAVQLADKDSGKLLKAVTVAADGAFSFPSYVFGPGGFVVTANAPYGVAGSAMGTVDQSGAAAIDIVLPVVSGSVAGVVTAKDGSPLPDAAIYLSAPTGEYEWTTTAADGTYRLDNVLSGPAGLTASAQYPGGVTVDQPVTLTVQGATETANFTLDVVKTTLALRVLAGDQQTPVQDAELYVFAGANLVTSLSTDSAGLATAVDLWVPPGGLTVQAAYNYDNLNVSSQVNVPNWAPSHSIDLVLPMSVVRGTVTMADMSPLNRPTAVVAGADGVTHHARRTTTTGEFIVFGTAVGPFTLTVQDRFSGVQMVVTDTLTDVNTAVVRTLTLPATGTVTGHLYDRQGTPLAGEQVVLLSPSLAMDVWEYTDTDGAFTFNTVPAGPVSVFAAPWAGGNIDYMSATGNLTAGTPLVLDLNPPQLVTLKGTVLEPNAVASPFAYVDIEAYAGAGPLGHFTASTTANAQGQYVVVGVPKGMVKVTVRDQNWWQGGIAFALASADPTTVDVTLGTAVDTSVTLTGSNGFTYTVGDTGVLSGGSTTASQPAFSYTYDAYVNDDFVCCDYFPGLGAGGRQLTFGPLHAGTALLHTRKVFVPQSGGFIRYLEVLENPTGIPMRTTMKVGASVNPSASTTHWVALPADTGNTYMLLDDTWNGHAPETPATAHVMAGTGAVASPARVQPATLESGVQNYSEISWQAIVPPGGRVAFLHYGVIREPADAAGAQTAAESLVNLSDPDALQDLAPEDLSAIVNFIVP